jgi:hypothetical protein
MHQQIVYFMCLLNMQLWNVSHSRHQLSLLEPFELCLNLTQSLNNIETLKTFFKKPFLAADGLKILDFRFGNNSATSLQTN